MSAPWHVVNTVSGICCGRKEGAKEIDLALGKAFSSFGRDTTEQRELLFSNFPQKMSKIAHVRESCMRVGIPRSHYITATD